MTDTRHVADMIDAHLTAHAIPIEPTQRDRIADMIDHYVDVVHVNQTETDVIDALNDPKWAFEIGWEIIELADPEPGDTDYMIIMNHLTPIIHQLLTT